MLSSSVNSPVTPALSAQTPQRIGGIQSKRQKVMGYLRRKLAKVPYHVNPALTVRDLHVDEPLSKEQTKRVEEFIEVVEDPKSSQALKDNRYAILEDEVKHTIIQMPSPTGNTYQVIRNKTPKVKKVKIDSPVMPEEMFPDRQVINRQVKKDGILAKTNPSLVYYLRTKFFLKFRDHALMQTMVHEARMWLLKNGHTCDNKVDYETLTSAVTVAFMITKEEIAFRQLIKNKKNFDNMVHLNKTVTGNLGRAAGLREVKSLGHSFLSEVHLPTRPIVA